MRHISGRFLSVFLEETFMVQVPVLAIHGGAGTINREALSAEAEREYRGALQSILEKGRDALTAGTDFSCNVFLY